ncbi:Bug family tripartite tricarboxylate transporter substrate binding protein [Bordetella sp. 02P26C-1]|uniref:Bug family tripartite tricarboxylate transporter substrate binding protein n=1 Tax=Bordetella sp. 02P26C-1 TaxID=2683195 RepID=UPI001353F8AC|nr:tripartite tricarboxylate transporter substrate binding protein [Bordetella sp. 02P26C-1]MVW79930.1 tripartite tricarboxylate transporter substrate binding protein [Bordetella sp. 02P26C-1]
MRADAEALTCQTRRRLMALGALTAFAFGTPGVAATTESGAYPSRPITIVVGGPPAGGTDFIARLVADNLARDLKQSVVVENRAGASGLIGAKHVQKAAPDGYTFLMGQAATHAILPALQSQPAYDAVKDFTPISLVATAPEVLVVASDSPLKSVADYIDYAKQHPGKVSYGTPGVGQPQHILGERFAKATSTDLLHVPYNGSGPALTDLVGGRLVSMFVTPGAVMPFIRDGRVRALAVSSKERSALMPDVPTLAESGVQNADQTGWFALFAPAGLADDRRLAMEKAVMKVLANPEVKQKLTGAYVEPGTISPADFAAFHQGEVSAFSDIVGGLKLQLNN